MTAPIIGIDLGTTNSLCAVFEEGTPRLLRNGLEEVLTPSIVGLTPAGEILVGGAAQELAVTQPERTATCFKRWMGGKNQIKLGAVSLVLLSFPAWYSSHYVTTLPRRYRPK